MTQTVTWMIRWKRTPKNGWYTLPQTFLTEGEAISKAKFLNQHRLGKPPPYRIEVVTSTPIVVWKSNDSIPPAELESTVPNNG